MTATVVKEATPPAPRAPTARAGGACAGAAGSSPCCSRSRAAAARRARRLPGAVLRRPQLLRRLRHRVRRRRELRRDVPRPGDPHGHPQHGRLGRRRPDPAHRARPDPRRAGGEGPLGHRLQTAAVHADGGLLPRRRHHLPARLRRGPRQGRPQRGRRLRPRRLRRSSSYPTARARDGQGLTREPDGSYVTAADVSPGDTQALGLVGVAPKDLPGEAGPASKAASDTAAPDEVRGVVYLDFTPGGEEAGRGRPRGERTARRDRRGGARREDGSERHHRVRRLLPLHRPRRRRVRPEAALGQLRPALRGRLLARPGAGHPGDHRGVPVDLDRVRDGADRGGPVHAAPGRAGGGPDGRRQRVADLPQDHRPAARARPDRGVRDAGDQRDEGLRPRLHHRARTRAGGRDRPRHPDVAGVLRRRQQPGLGSALGVLLLLLVIPAMVFNVRRFKRSQR